MRSRLPAEGAILVRHDEVRFDAMKAIIVGTAGTPYANGIFLFDIYFPSEYPSCPLQIFNCTTGGGTVEMNSNLYSDGKVCLSLLGTSGSDGDKEARWNSETSSLVQVLLSIQAFILVPQPLANYPGVEKGTDAFQRRSDAFDQDLWLATVRHAMLAPLRHPPLGFEEAVRTHFGLRRGVLRRQCLEWVRDANDAVQPRLASAVQELFALLDAL
ncbi:hypothetical protein EMIHUDRAFT_65168 [Emiliania huxleyi CCMP1516]|uniref:UBC core domain-containing protein n=3 Tax=Emiliania huxleyi TaxID=2903 RepID=A0A0D3JF99_EMIH1|nr:hypothetical protein EMIHUDRAFT_65168 [Emiliania huxleyi CCMP1516]EOD22184.1 hypothetical protein EMIHUDRAFT_65168 [Emiliania huxleyi CCMP1516]|eukprot:XP_005774613.1 hypothetical protein EMIHUDRAFT_65168 [Emiliania huxleyi CCMP1516]